MKHLPSARECSLLWATQIYQTPSRSDSGAESNSMCRRFRELKNSLDLFQSTSLPGSVEWYFLESAFRKGLGRDTSKSLVQVDLYLSRNRNRKRRVYLLRQFWLHQNGLARFRIVEFFEENQLWIKDLVRSYVLYSLGLLWLTPNRRSGSNMAFQSSRLETSAKVAPLYSSGFQKLHPSMGAILAAASAASFGDS